MVAADIPARFIAGDTVKFTVTRQGYLPADGWSLSIALVNASSQFTDSATDNGDGAHLFVFDAAETTSLNPGDFRYQLYATLGAERHTIDDGVITVSADYSDFTGGYDDRSNAQIIIDNIDAVLTNTATIDQAAYSIAGRSLSRIPRTELMALRDKYSEIARRERNARRLQAGKPINSKVRVRM